LGEQHRAAGEIAWLVRRITQSIGAGGRVEHRRAPGPAPETWRAVSVLRAASPAEETDRIARRLRELHLVDGVAWSEMAVIAHDTRQLVALEAELAARDVPTRAAGVPRPLGSEPAVRQIAEIVRLGLTPAAERDPAALTEALRSPYGGGDGVAPRRLRAGLRDPQRAGRAADRRDRAPRAHPRGRARPRCAHRGAALALRRVRRRRAPQAPSRPASRRARRRRHAAGPRAARRGFRAPRAVRLARHGGGPLCRALRGHGARGGRARAPRRHGPRAAVARLGPGPGSRRPPAERRLAPRLERLRPDRGRRNA